MTRLPDPPFYTYKGCRFQHAALILNGSHGTYAVLDEVGLNDDFCGREELTDILPDGTHDGITQHDAAIVVFVWTSASNLDDDQALEPVKHVPVTLEEVAHVLLNRSSLWSLEAGGVEGG